MALLDVQVPCVIHDTVTWLATPWCIGAAWPTGPARSAIEEHSDAADPQVVSVRVGTRIREDRAQCLPVGRQARAVQHGANTLSPRRENGRMKA